jgi:hypothetical protein
MDGLEISLLLLVSLFFGVRAIFWPTVSHLLMASTVFVIITPYTHDWMPKTGLIVLVLTFSGIAYQIVVEREKEEKLWAEECRISQNSHTPVEYERPVHWETGIQ